MNINFKTITTIFLFVLSASAYSESSSTGILKSELTPVANSNPFLMGPSSAMVSKNPETKASTVDDADPFAGVVQPLDPNKAFKISVQEAPGALHVKFSIKPAYKLYKDKFKFSASGAGIQNVDLPNGVLYLDPEFGKVSVFENELNFSVPMTYAEENAKINITYQGCTDGLCYPPQTHTVSVEAFGDATPQAIKEKTSIDKPETKLSNAELGSYIAFLLLGLGMALTPCVFPMYPILSSIIVGEKKKTASRTLWLSFLYVQGMALIYSLMGVVVALAGLKFQVFMQQPAIIIAVCVLFIFLALSMFGVITIQPPASYQTALSNAGNKQKSGSSFGAFGMGALAGLVASPCTTAPLTGILLYIANTGNTVTGFFSLYALSMGMGIPLIIFALTGGSLMGKMKPYMTTVKNLFGFALLGMSIYFAERFLSTDIIATMYALLALGLGGYFIYESCMERGDKPKSVFFTIGIFLIFVSAININNNLLMGERGKTTPHEESSNLNSFKTVSSIVELEKAKGNGKPSMLDLYASWCTACIQYEKHTFTDPAVKKEMEKYNLIKIDMTENTEFTTLVQEKMSVVGLPAILFFDENGVEIKSKRATGFMDADNFILHLKK